MCWRIWVGVVLSLLTIAVGPAYSGDLNFTIINNTNQSIVKLWTSPTASGTWFEATHVYVPDGGQRQKVEFDHSANGSDCVHDIKFQFQGGTTREINHINLCDVATIAIGVSKNGDVIYKLDPSNDDKYLVLGLAIIALGLAIYFLPTTIASKRKIAMGAGTMFWINLAIGWTIVGWLFLILLAACAKTKAEDLYYRKATDEPAVR